MFDLPPDLNRPFPPNKVKKNPKGFDYVGIEDYIERLNEVLGSRWSWNIKESNLILEDHGKIEKTRNGKGQFLATVRGTLTVVFVDLDVVRSDDKEVDGVLTTSSIEVQRDGIGAAVSFDPDMALKTAQAEALKKACHQYGIALYLWHEDERDFVALQKKAQASDSDLKRLAVEHVKRTLKTDDMPTVKDIAGVLGIEEGDLSDMALLRTALTTNGVI